MLLQRFLLTWDKLDIIVHKDVGSDDFDFGRGEETSRTGPKAVAKVDMIGASCRMLVLELVTGLFTEIGKAESVKAGGVMVQLRIVIDGVADDHDKCSFGNDFAGGKLETPRVGDDARNVD